MIFLLLILFLKNLDLIQRENNLLLPLLLKTMRFLINHILLILLLEPFILIVRSYARRRSWLKHFEPVKINVLQHLMLLLNPLLKMCCSILCAKEKLWNKLFQNLLFFVLTLSTPNPRSSLNLPLLLNQINQDLIFILNNKLGNPFLLIPLILKPLRMPLLKMTKILKLRKPLKSFFLSWIKLFNFRKEI